MDTPCATTACSKRLAAMCASETATVPLLLPKLCPASAGCAGSAGWLCWPRSAAMAANEMVCVIPTANGRWTADSQHAVDGLRTLDCWLEPTWSRRHQHGEPSKFLKLWRSEIKPSYINRLAPLLRIHTAKSKRRRLGRRLCSAAGRASNARRCGLWTLDYRPHPFINKNHTTITWMIDWMLSMHPIPLRCWPRVQTQNSAKMMKTRWQMAAVLADGAAHRKKIKNVRNGNLVHMFQTTNQKLVIATPKKMQIFVDSMFLPSFPGLFWHRLGVANCACAPAFWLHPSHPSTWGQATRQPTWQRLTGNAPLFFWH